MKNDPLGNPVDKQHPWNQTTTPQPQKRDFNGNYTWVMSPRWFDKRTGDHLALDTGGGPIARLWATALAGLVDIGYVKATGQQREDLLAQDGHAAGSRVRMEDSEVEQRHRARSRPHLLPGVRGGRAPFTSCEKALKELHAGALKTWTDFKVPEEAIGCGFHEAVRGVLSHHVVIRDGKIANYHPYPPTPWNANPRDSTARPVRTKMRCRTRRSSRRTGRTNSRASTSCARCAASIPACPAAFICTWATARCWRRGIRRCSATSVRERHDN